MLAEPAIVVTLDIGGSAAKASAYDVARRTSLGTAAAPYPPAPAGQDPDMFDPTGWWLAAIQALRDLRDRVDSPASQYVGITVSAIRIPFVMLDERDEPTMPGLLNRDRRATPQVDRLISSIGSAELYRITGHWAAPEFGLPKLLWVRDRYPDAWRATRTLLQLHDWFIYRLSGVRVSELSSAAMSQLIDRAVGTWASSVLAPLGISASLLPEVRPAGSLAGPLLADVADATGFMPGTPVYVGGGDTHMSALSAQSGALSDSGPVVVAGTTTPVVDFVPTERLPHHDTLFPLLLSDHVVAGLTTLEANAGPTGKIADQLRCTQGLSADLGAQLAARGAILVDSDSEELVVLAGNPYFGPDGWIAVPPATVIGLRDWHTGTDVVRACHRASAYAVAAMIACHAEHTSPKTGPVIVTGGMSRSTAWQQLLADITGRTVTSPPLQQIAGRGGALIVTGSFGTDHGQSAWRRFTPDAGMAETSAAALDRYQAYYRTAQFDSGKQVGY